jgi:lipopolysaccharide transport system ATP-binding protein
MGSMSDIMICANALGKRYRIGRRQTGYRTLRESFANLAGAPARVIRTAVRRENRQPPENSIWALRDLEFEIRKGEIVGVIGRNGAGKSTLLKVLSRITEPTTGRVELRGRVGSLLEVGTGFHPELSGRENIYLNGAILGMRRAEIDRRFDEIVAFAEVDRFLDTPVKRYSSGMFVRLAFAVAAHLETEILLVDEVLSVGDVAFQRRSIGRMEQVASSGTTVVFVSHNLAAVRTFCTRAILLQHGRLQADGKTTDVTREYLDQGDGRQAIRRWDDQSTAPGGDEFRLRAIGVSVDGNTTGAVLVEQSFEIRVDYTVYEPLTKMRLCIQLLSEDGTVVLQSSEQPDRGSAEKPPGKYTSICRVPQHLLNEGFFRVTVSADVPFAKVLCVAESAVGFSVEGARFHERPERWPGLVCPELEWRVRHSNKPEDQTSILEER